MGLLYAQRFYQREAGGSELVTTEAGSLSDAMKAPQAKECRWPLEAGKDKKMDSPLESLVTA